MTVGAELGFAVVGIFVGAGMGLAVGLPSCGVGGGVGCGVVGLGVGSELVVGFCVGGDVAVVGDAVEGFGDGFGDFVKRHEPCVVRGWGLEGPYAALLEKFGDDAYLKERCGSRVRRGCGPALPSRGS